MIGWIILAGCIAIIVVVGYICVQDTIEHEARGCVSKWVGSHIQLMLIGKVLMPMTVNDYVWVCPN